jgi:endonuclease/exonuclease/phosphatase family metal-dependent hydrolase
MVMTWRKLSFVFVVFFAGSTAAPAQEPPALSAEAALPVINWADAGKYLDREVIVQGRIVDGKVTKNICFLNFDAARSFSVIIHQPNFKNFPQPPEALYPTKIVRIRGVVVEYRGKPQMELIRPDQVRILEKEEPVTSQPTSRPHGFDGVVTIGAFNVLNMFDEYDDPYRMDESTPAKAKEDLQKLAATIRSLDADVLALEEVENRGILERFVGAFLSDMGYDNVICIEGNDQRGIDCALLSRLPVGLVISHQYERFPDAAGKEMKFRRDLLQVRIEPPGAPAFWVFVVHLKSKGGGGDTEKYRVGETTAARKILDDLLAKEADALFVICGDFNDTWDSKSLKIVRGEGPTALRGFIEELPKDAATYNKPPRGIIDFILSSPAMATHYLPKSYRIVSGTAASSGSDHNPVLVQFDLRPKK